MWLNGTFGVGKTTTARELVPLMARTRLFDPELVGTFLTACLPDREVADFQDRPAWRELVVQAIIAVVQMTGQDLVVVQSVLNEGYWQELRTGLVGGGLEVLHVLLTADETALRHRAEEDPQTRDWRLAHMATYAAARQSWMEAAADVVVDSTLLSATTVAQTIDEIVRHGG